MINMELQNLYDLSEKYLDSKQHAWSESTLKSERSRLRSALRLLNKLGGFHPELVYKQLKEAGRKPYTIKTTFIRLGTFEEWLIEEGFIESYTKSRFQGYMRRWLRQFRKAYSPTRRALHMESEEVVRAKIDRISNADHRLLAALLFATGLRFAEASTICPTRCEVKGKGGIRRTYYGSKAWPPEKAAEVGRRVTDHSSFYKSLKRVGLSPHLLRKYAATRFAKKLSAQDLMRVMGWSDISTAAVYLLPQTEDKIKEALYE